MTEKTENNIPMDEVGRNMQTPQEWARWLLDKEKNRPKSPDGQSYSRAPEELAKWIAGLAGEDTPERLLALLNLIPEMDIRKKEELIRICCKKINKDPYRPPTAFDKRKIVTPQALRELKEDGGVSPYKQFNPEAFFKRLKGHPNYKPAKTLPVKLPVKVPLAA